MIKCPSCGKRNPNDNKFCGECGTDLSEAEMHCPNCGKIHVNGEKFCTECGEILINIPYYEGISKRDSMKLNDSYSNYNSIEEIPENLLILFLKEEHIGFNSKSNFIDHMGAYWSKNEIKKFIRKFNNSIPKLNAKLEEQNFQKEKQRFPNFIMDNIDDICRIYSIPKVSKTYVVNYICTNYSEQDVRQRLRAYKR